MPATNPGTDHHIVRGNSFIAGLACFGMVSCGGGGSSAGDAVGSAPAPAAYSIGGTVTGLSGTLILADNGSDALTLTAAGAFTFAARLASGTSYATTVSTQPASQTCTVANGSGVVTATVTNIAVTCTSSTVATPTVSTIAGVAGAGSGATAVDGPANTATFHGPRGVAVDGSGNVFVSDDAAVLRKLTPAGTVSTVAGLYGVIGYADGAGAAARFTNPNALAVDRSGNVLVADRNNNAIRKVAPDGVVKTYAGGAALADWADGPLATARFGRPEGLAFDAAGNLYIADGYYNLVRKIASDGTVSTLAGTLTRGTGTTFGSGDVGFGALGIGIAADTAGNVFVVDTGDQIIRKITPTGVASVFAGVKYVGAAVERDGSGTAAAFAGPQGLAINARNELYTFDTVTGHLRKITPSGDVTTPIATATGYLDGPLPTARAGHVYGLAIDAAGSLVFADDTANVIRKIQPAP